MHSRRRQRPEAAIQRAVFEHLRMRGAPGVFAFHPANGGYRKPVEAAILKGLGVVAGVPDVFAVHNGRCFALVRVVAMGLEVETIEEAHRFRPVADYACDWEDWLQTQRVELNAMTTRQFIEWLDSKMAAHGKLIPPAEVLEIELDTRIKSKVRASITERILREAGSEEQVAAAIAAVKKPAAPALRQGIEEMFEREPEREWRDHIEEVAAERTRPGGAA